MFQLEHTELYFEQFEPFPEEGGIVKTIVELSDIQEIRDDAILTFDSKHHHHHRILQT